jgi:putative transposase
MPAPCIRTKYRKNDDDALLPMIRDIVDERTTYGYRRITVLLNRKRLNLGFSCVNHKRVYRIMKLHGLLLQRHTGRPNQTHVGKVITLKSNTRWCSDTFAIQCWNGDRVHVAFSLDTCDREAMRYIASTIGIDGAAIRDLMLETVEYRFGIDKVPKKMQWLSDNGPCYTARETVDFGRHLGFDICTTPSYSPESNGMAEAFVKTFKRDYVWSGNLQDAQTVMAQLPGWFEDYNEQAPHKGLKMCSPREFLRMCNLGN